MFTKYMVKAQSWAVNHKADLETRKDEEGAAMVEYGLLVAFIAVVALVGVKLLGTNLKNLFNGITF